MLTWCVGQCRIFHLRFNERELVQDIYFLRQLSHDEAARKVGSLWLWAQHCTGLSDAATFLRTLAKACSFLQFCWKLWQWWRAECEELISYDFKCVGILAVCACSHRLPLDAFLQHS